MLRTLTIDPQAPDAATVQQAAALIRAGQLVAFPTETVYGLGADATNDDAVRSIYVAKGRPSNNPLIVHVADRKDAQAIAGEWPAAAELLTQQFWPGPLTVILNRNDDSVSQAVSGGGPTVALRMPNHPVALSLIRAAGVPIAAPSANRSGHTSPTRAQHVAHSLGDNVPLILDAGALPGGIESTVIDLTSSPPRLLRPGLLSIAQIEEVIGRVDRPVIRTDAQSGPMASPGLLTRHYAPRTPLILCSHIQAALQDHAGENVGLIVLQPTDANGAPLYAMPNDPAGYARELYHALHQLDQCGLDLLIAELPPDTDEWLGVRDRLQRAATP